MYSITSYATEINIQQGTMAPAALVNADSSSTVKTKKSTGQPETAASHNT
jgi:hypothetical protein